MKKLILTIGLPRSGKSTWAIKQGYPIVCRDAIRLALHGEVYIQEAEEMVTAIENYMVKSLFLAGHDTIIIDACHLRMKYRERWDDLLESMFKEYDIEHRSFAISKEECIERAKKDGRDELIPIIERMKQD